MQPKSNLTTTGLLAGWALVEAHLDSQYRHSNTCLRIRRNSRSDETEIILSVRRNGRIQELIELPDDVASVVWQPPKYGGYEEPKLKIRGVGRIERTLRMAGGVLWKWARLSRDERLTSGLSLWQALVDLSGAYRIATGSRVRYSYPDWIKRFDALDDSDCRQICTHIARFAGHPHFHLLLVTDGAGREAVQRTLASLRGQLYRNFTCSVLGNGDAFASSLEFDSELKDAGFDSYVVAQQDIVAWLGEFNGSLTAGRAGDWVLLLRAGDALPAHALYWFACEALARPDAVVVYSDDDTVDADGKRRHPRFKPDWSPAHLRSTHYVGEAAILRGGAIAAAGGVSLDCCRHWNYDLLLRIVDATGGNVAHIPAVLFHRAGSDEDEGEINRTLLSHPRQLSLSQSEIERDRSEWSLDALRKHLARNGAAAEVSETLPGCWRVRYRLPETPPMVSIIVPTRDTLPLLRQCLECLLEKTTYPRFEILMVDNQSADPDALTYLDQIARHPAVRVLRYDRVFNFSAINNFAAREAGGEILCLLNNDTEVISPDWLEEMVGHLLQPRVGVVGAKLYYPDGRVQHAGDAVGPGGCANHLHSLIGRDDPGYCGRAAVAQELSAVTGACLITAKDLYFRLGGLDEKRLGVAFNDVDYCLRVQEAGYHVVWTPHAELYHHESVSRGRDQSWRRKLRAAREVATMRRRWGHVMKNDPFYNPNLSYRQPDFSLSHAPRVKKPWLPAVS